MKFLSKKSKSVPTLNLGHTTAAAECEKVDLLNSFFHSCFNKSHAPIAPLKDLHFAPSAEYLCTEEEVFDLLASLDVSKASGPDGISARMLKYTATS